MYWRHWMPCALKSAPHTRKINSRHTRRSRFNSSGTNRNGKTAAYLLPILNKLSEGGHPADAINCIVMAPTRELAQQIDQQMEGFSYFMPVSSVAVYGGNDGVLFEQQKRGLTLGRCCHCHSGTSDSPPQSWLCRPFACLLFYFG